MVIFGSILGQPVHPLRRIPQQSRQTTNLLPSVDSSLFPALQEAVKRLLKFLAGGGKELVDLAGQTADRSQLGCIVLIAWLWRIVDQQDDPAVGRLLQRG